jgi:S1-C subfamily serine protease
MNIRMPMNISGSSFRILVALAAVVATSTACGSAAGTSVEAAPPKVPAVVAPDENCPKVSCDPNHDYGQPSLSSLRDLETKLASTRTTSAPTASTASGSTATSGSGVGGSTSTPTSAGQPGPAGPAGPAGAAGPAGPNAADFTAVYTRFRHSIARIETADCGGQFQAIGSGFVIAPTLVATAGHVVKHQHILRLYIDGHLIPARAIGFDDPHDVALVQLSRPVTAASVPLATAWPSVSSPLAVLGYAQGGPLSMQQGHVAAVNVTVNGTAGYLETDTAEDHGSSGGPVFDRQGRAVAIVSKSVGQAGLVHLEAGSIGAAHFFSIWRAHPHTVPGTC